MDYRDTVFISVAENLSFSKAANQLHISQPAVSKHIQELENKYNANLFERKGNKTFLTRIGNIVYNSLKEIEQQYRNLDFEIGKLNDTVSGRFIIGASSTISQYVIPKVLASFYKVYPNISIHLINGNSFEMEQLLLANKVDLALVENQSSQTGIRYKNFLHDELVVVAGSHSLYANLKSISKMELLQLPIVLREKGSGTLEVIQEALNKMNLSYDDLNTPIQIGSTESIKNFLQEFDGISILSEKAVVDELFINKLVKIHVKDFMIPWNFRIALKLGHKSYQVELFEKFLLDYNF